LASGTLAPLNSFAAELRLEFPVFENQKEKLSELQSKYVVYISFFLSFFFFFCLFSRVNLCHKANMIQNL
jgi:hypothetical protein